MDNSGVLRWLPAALFLLAGLAGVSGKITSDYELRIQSFRMEFERALVESQATMVFRMTDLKQKLAESLTQEPDPAVLGSILYLDLSPGNITQLEIYRKSDCRLIAKSKTGQGIRTSCPAHSGDDGLYTWDHPDSENRGIFRLAGTLKVPGDSSFWLAGYMNIDHDWANSRPFLRKDLKDLKIGFEDRGIPGFPLYLSPDRKNPLMVYSQSALISWAGQSRRDFSTVFYRLSVWAIFAALIAYFFVLQGFTGNIGNQIRLRKKFYSFVKNLMGQKLALPGALNIQTSESWQDSLAKIQCLDLSQLRQLELEEFKKYSQTVKEQAGQLISLTDENTWLKKQLSYASECAVLKDQVLESAGFLQKITQDHASMIAGIQTYHGKNLGDSFQQLHSLMRFWQNGIGEHGARKFFRSLCETPSEQKGLHQFDHSVRQFLCITSQVCAFSDELEKCFGRIRKYFLNMDQVLSHWSSLALVDPSMKAAESKTLEEFFKKTGSLLQSLNPERQRILEQDTVTRSWALPSLPEIIFQAACMLLIRMAEPDGKDQGKIYVSGKTGTNCYYLFFHSFSKGIPGNHPSENNLNLRHLSLAKNLLSPWDLGCGYIPSGPSTGSFMVSWASPGPLSQNPGERLVNTEIKPEN